MTDNGGAGETENFVRAAAKAAKEGGPMTTTDYAAAIAALARELVHIDCTRALQRADLWEGIARQMPAESAASYRLRAEAVKQAAAEATADRITKVRDIARKVAA